MKKRMLLFVFTLALISCSKDLDDKAEVSVSDYYGKWVQYVEAEYADDPSSKQFSYQFNKDNTFTKTRKYDNSTTVLSGTFEITNDENVTRFVLTYNGQNFLISNCTGGLTESLTLDNAGYLNDDASMCDRYGKYEKAK